MKKIVSALVALGAAVACIVGLVACGEKAEPVTKVAGKTYIFKDLDYKYGNLVGGSEQEQIEAIIAQLKTLYKGATIEFDNNGKYTSKVMSTAATTGTYTQDKAEVIMNGSDNIVIEATVSGNELSYDYLTVYTFHFKLKENNGGTDYDDGNLSVNSKIFRFNSATGADANTAKTLYAGSSIDFMSNGAYYWYIPNATADYREICGRFEQDGEKVTCRDGNYNEYHITVISSKIISIALDNVTLKYAVDEK